MDLPANQRTNDRKQINAKVEIIVISHRNQFLYLAGGFALGDEGRIYFFLWVSKTLTDLKNYSNAMVVNGEVLIGEIEE